MFIYYLEVLKIIPLRFTNVVISNGHYFDSYSTTEQDPTTSTAMSLSNVSEHLGVTMFKPGVHNTKYAPNLARMRFDNGRRVSR